MINTLHMLFHNLILTDYYTECYYATCDISKAYKNKDAYWT